MIKKKEKRKKKKEKKRREKAVKNNWSEKVKKLKTTTTTKTPFWVIYRESRGRGGIKLSLRKRQQRNGRVRQLKMSTSSPCFQISIQTTVQKPSIITVHTRTCSEFSVALRPQRP